MLESIFLLMFHSGPHVVHDQKDCGAKSNQHIIALTKSLIAKRGKLEVPIGEMPTKHGRYACTRLTFNINELGAAQNILVQQDYNSFLLDISAVETLKKYKFKSNPRNKINHDVRYSLVFTAIVNKAPPYP